jgi:hypothetical protein
VAGQPPCPHDLGNQNRTLRSVIAPVRGETDRNDQAGVLGSNAILDNRGFGTETPTVPGLFQAATGAFRLGWRAARTW